jgi:hypothetical protein
MNNWQQITLGFPIFADEAPEIPLKDAFKQRADGSFSVPVPVEQELMKKGSFDSVSAVQDHTGARYVAFVYNNGYGATGRVIGPPGRQWELVLPPLEGIPHKADSISLLMVGNSLVVHMTSHATNEGPRVMAVWEATIPVVEEPCGDVALHYFRPGAPVTRGQLCKILAIELFTDEELREAAQGSQRFADVPPGSTFYPFIGKLAESGAIGGYGCTKPKE